MTEHQYGPPPQAPQPPPRQAKVKKTKKWPWVLGLILAFGLGAAVGSAGKTTPASSSAAPTTVTVAAPVGGAVAPAQPPAAPAEPKTDFGDGTYLVGTDIAVGSYKSNGPREGGVGQCYWARLKDDSGSNIIANGFGAGATRVTVKKGEYLQVTGCDFTKA